MNRGPVAHGTSTHTGTEKSFYGTVAGSISSARIEGTRMYLIWLMYSCLFSPVAHQLYNDSFNCMNVHIAGAEYIRNSCQDLLDPLQRNNCW